MSAIPIEDREPGLVAHCASEIDLERVVFVWEGRIALGKHTCIAGEPGTSKSTLTTSIAATVSVGGRWPCGEGISPQGSVIILSAEDGAADTILPRLHAAGADCGRVYIVTAVRTGDGTRGFNLQADIALLEKLIDDIGDVALVIIDPISSYLGKADSHKNAEVRGVLEPLSAMAQRKRVAVLSVTHFSKSGAVNNAKALHRFIGSIAFVGAPRMAFAVIEDAENADRRLLLHAKNNLARPPQGLAFSIREITVGDGIAAPCVRFEDAHVDLTANEALAAEAGRDRVNPREEAEEFLRDLLADGPVLRKDVEREAEGADLAWRTVRRAKVKLGVVAKRVGGIAGKGQWEWSLPNVSTYPLRCLSEKVDTLDTLGNSQRVAGDETPKVANSFDGHLSEYPELPACLDRRKRAI